MLMSAVYIIWRGTLWIQFVGPWCQELLGFKNYLCKKLLGVKTTWCQKLLGAKNAWYQNYLVPKTTWCQNYLVSKTTRCQKLLGAKTTWCQKLLGVINYLVSNTTWKRENNKMRALLTTKWSKLWKIKQNTFSSPNFSARHGCVWS